MKNIQIFSNTLPPQTVKLLNLIQTQQSNFLNEFYLSGGTALSLQLGHRESEDLDFFTQNSFNPQKWQQKLLKLGKLTETELAEGTVNTYLNGVKLQFLEYPYPLIKPLVEWRTIRLSSVEDVACTKLQTIGMRGSKKDFVDLYFLLEKYALDELFMLMEDKYQGVDYSKTHIMKSLVYFKDAEQQPMPRLHQEVSWGEVKKRMIEAVKTIEFKSNID
jgi:predicted nucleotidyltransferase component of viral defense system